MKNYLVHCVNNPWMAYSQDHDSCIVKLTPSANPIDTFKRIEAKAREILDDKKLTVLSITVLDNL